MDPYLFIFSNSLRSILLLSLNSESAWFAARTFGVYDMRLATLAAFSGSMIGMAVNFGIGYYLSGTRAKWFNFSEESYKRISRIFTRYVVWILLFPQIMLFFPLLSLIGLFTAFVGLFRVPPALALTVIAIGRVGYYGYYLLNS